MSDTICDFLGDVHKLQVLIKTKQLNISKENIKRKGKHKWPTCDGENDDK